MKDKNTECRIIQIDERLQPGANIKRLRKEKALKQTEFLARLQLMGIDISIYSLNRIEQGTQNPTVSFLLMSCKILSCDMNEIFNFKSLEDNR